MPGGNHRGLLWSDLRVKPPYGSVRIDRGHPISAGLLDYLLFNEGAGQTMRNLVAPNASATGTSAPTWDRTAGGIGIAVTGGSYVGIPNHGNIVAGDFSVRCVFMPTTYTGAYTTLLAKVNADREIGVFINTSGQVQFVQLGATSVDGLARGSMPTGAVADFFLTRVGSTCQVYVNGVAAGATFSLSGTTPRDGVLRYGNDQAGSGTSMTGVYIHTAIWPGRAFSASEIAELYVARYSGLRPIIPRRYFVPAGAGQGGAEYHYRRRRSA